MKIEMIQFESTVTDEEVRLARELVLELMAIEPNYRLYIQIKMDGWAEVGDSWREYHQMVFRKTLKEDRAKGCSLVASVMSKKYHEGGETLTLSLAWLSN